MSSELLFYFRVKIMSDDFQEMFCIYGAHTAVDKNVDQ